ncbi:MAG: protein translocase subunit SecD [Micropepsaceae bacterium]
MRTPVWRLVAYVLIILAGAATALPNLFTPQQLALLPDWLPKQQVALGLDLRGGAHLVLEVDAKALVTERLQDLTRSARRALRDAKIETQSVRRDGEALIVTLDDAGQRAEATRVLSSLSEGKADALGQTASELEITETGPADLRVALSQAGLNARVTAAAEQSLEIIRLRIDETGLAEPTLQRVGTDRILVQLPGVEDPQRIKEIIGSTAKLTFHLVRDMDPASVPPPGVSILPGKQAGERYAIEDRVMLSGERLSDAGLGFDATTGEPVVTFRLDGAGARQFGAITTQHVGRPFAIVLDGEVLTAPVIQTPIIGGSGQISGSFTSESASDLAALLRAGALPAPLTVIEERTVGADLGKDAIEKGLTTGLLGFAAVFAFMFVLYGRWGLIANIALALNVILTFAILSVLGATLTLPGIAGIVLGIGLAVDANVLINERIREETRKGLSAMAALDAGFKRAFSTIVDSNVTALIATLLLFMFGTGSVRGFAVTMGIGIAISMFTAVTVVRVMMSAIVRRWRMKVMRIEPLFRMKLIPDGTSIPFMRARYMGLAFSAFLSIASIALFVTPGLNYGVDFKGGIQLEVVTKGPADLAAFRSGLNTLELGEVALQEFGDASTVLVRAERQAGAEAEQRTAVDKMRAKILEISPGAKIVRSEVVGPKVSGELAETGILAVVLASFAMLAYIWARFEWPFAVGAIATLVLDVTKTVGFFAITGIEFNLTAIAALLTLIGYSVNDKVVVYDRMRENMRLYKSMDLRMLIDRSINETLARSLYTSVTALIALVPMAIWGGSAVESFAVPMVFGIVIAASSSVFIAAPILLLLGDWRTRRRVSTPVVSEAAAA